MTYTSKPVIGGATFPRPNSVDEANEQGGTDVTLANGSTRRYDGGDRFVVTLGWNRLDEATKSALLAAAGRGAISYVHLDGTAYVVLVDGRPHVAPVAGTDPQRFAVELTLRQRDPSR